MKKDRKALQDHFVVIQNLLFVGAIVMLAAVFFQNSPLIWIPAVLGFLIMIASIVYAAKYFKCPHCSSKLDPRRKVPNFCPNCGKSLYEE